MIKISNITKRYDKLTVLNGISLEIPDGQTVAIIGPSGCGKSTLLRLILRLEDVDAGSILIDNQNIGRLSDEALIKIRQKIGMVFQSSALFDSMTVVVSKKLGLVGLSGKENIMPAELSGGMQKRVSIARALAFDPKIILYDEPTTGLDPITSTNIENLINKLSEDLNVTSIIVTHQLSTIFRTADRIIMLHDGKFIDSGSVVETRKSNNPIIRDFINAGM